MEMWALSRLPFVLSSLVNFDVYELVRCWEVKQLLSVKSSCLHCLFQFLFFLLKYVGTRYMIYCCFFFQLESINSILRQVWYFMYRKVSFTFDLWITSVLLFLITMISLCYQWYILLFGTEYWNTVFTSMKITPCVPSYFIARVVNPCHVHPK